MPRTMTAQNFLAIYIYLSYVPIFPSTGKGDLDVGQPQPHDMLDHI
jgi:hypothetical protein